MLSYMTCDNVTYSVDEVGYNDANWCSEEYDALYEEQKVELDPARRREIVAEMLRLFNREGSYLVLLQDADTQAYRTDRFEGWLQQPAGSGPVLFSNSSPSYANLSVIGAEPAPSDTTVPATDPSATSVDGSSTVDAVDDGTASATATATADDGADTSADAPATADADADDGGGSNTGVIVLIVIIALAVIGGIVFAVSRRASADDRE
jgi:peptide/nickel transport system substrate-binding protein